jgi:hypothetical protein
MKRFMLALLILTPGIAEAQAERLYVGIGAGSHVEDADSVSGIAPAAGVVAGVRLSPRWGIEAEVSRPAHAFAREYTGIGQTFAGPGASQAEIEHLGVLERFRNERTVRHTISVGAVFHPAARGRFHPRVFMGLTNHHASERSIITVLRLPDGVDPERLRNVRSSAETHTRHFGGLTVGGGLGIKLARRFSIAPELRYDYGSIGDEINNTLRTSLRAVWTF